MHRVVQSSIDGGSLDILVQPCMWFIYCDMTLVCMVAMPFIQRC